MRFVCPVQFELRIICSQQSKVSGFTRNRKQEQLVTNAVIAAEHIPDAHVTLPAEPGQPALVTSQSDQSIQYRVTGACTETASCSCPQGTLGYFCKHRVKVIAQLSGCKKQDIVLFLGTWAGSSRGGMQQLLKRSDTDAQPDLDSWAQLTENLQLEQEAQQHEQGMACTTKRQATIDSNSVTKSSKTGNADMLAQFQRLLDQSNGNADLRNILLSKLNQAEGSFQQLASRNLAGLSQPAQAIEKVQDGLNDSTVRLKSALEGLTKGQRRPNQAVARVDVSSLPPVAPLPKPQPSKKKRSFAQLLSNSSSKQDDKENSNVAANIPDASARPVSTTAAPAMTPAMAAISDPDMVSSGVPGSAGPTTAVSKTAKPSQPAKQPRTRKCGFCANCLKPKSKQKCLTLAVDRAKFGQADASCVGSLRTAV